MGYRQWIWAGLLSCVWVGVGCADSAFVRIEKLSDRVVVAYWLGTHRANLVAVKGRGGLVMIDTEMSPRIMAPIKRAIERVFGRDDWTHVINTHGHMHHIGGNCLFEGATIVGHAKLPDDMRWLEGQQLAENESFRLKQAEARRQEVAKVDGWLQQMAPNDPRARKLRGARRFCELHAEDIEETFEVVPPTVTFADRHAIDLGDLRLDLIYCGNMHSRSDIVVSIPQDGVLVAGAVCYRRLPRIPEKAQLVDIQRRIDVFDALLKSERKIAHVVPSHSLLLKARDLEQARDYFRTMLDAVGRARREKLTLEQVQKQLSVRRQYPHYWQRFYSDQLETLQNANIERLWGLLASDRTPSQD